ncbi:TonB-dependent receptor [Sphingopyxis sp. JAI108]|uniref:TonB-dependent receptor n=1 Tax=Sphingopyxis sp. JAI108 TaxID=2723060 RepID=UPI0015CB9529|nr:TonB-dependent receptor [Sphingopyxis sp. JAI108]NYF33636.1 outer membrane receptor protein involved in Fe transport [Sphingopyxis sp. JAI108]
MKAKLFAAMLASSTAAIAIQVPSAQAQTRAAQQTYNIAPQDLATALQRYSQVSGREVIASGTLTAGKRSGRVTGRLTPDAALSRLLSGTGLFAEIVDGALVIRSGNGDAAEPGSTDTHREEAIIVTGSRIRGRGPAGSPLLAIDRDTLDRSGRATLADFIQTIPQNFSGGPAEANVGTSARGNAASNIGYGTGINLRGLGTGSTLTLLDGTRPALGGASGAFADISTLPSLAVERLEILTDGASAIYGSDAVAGVVNVRFRNRFEGAETRLRVSSADGDYSEYQLGQIVGTGWATGHIVVAGEYYRRGSLGSEERAFATEDLRPFGGPDLRSNLASPGTIVAANGQRFLIPRGQDGTALTPSQLISSSDFRRSDARRNVDILPRQESFSLYASGEQALGDHISLFARGLYAERHFEARRRVIGASPQVVGPDNPYYVDPIGTGEEIIVYYDPTANFGPEGVRGTVKALNTSFGARADIGSWNIELSGGYGRQREGYDGVNIVHLLRLARAIAASDPAQAINLFGDGAVNDPALIDSLRGSISVRTRYENWTAALRADGSLFTLPAGAVKLAIGAEYRRDSLDYLQSFDLVTDGPLSFGIDGLPDKRIVKAIYGELAIPVFDAGESFPGSLTFSAAGRYEHYSDVGDTANPKLGARWEPLPGLALRASYGRSFRAPFFDELVGTANAFYQTFYLNDPTSPTGQTAVLLLSGYRPDLGPEKATSWTAGIDFEPRFLPGAKLSLTYFDIRYRDRIASATSFLQQFLVRRDIYGGMIDDTPDLAEVAAYFADPNFFNAIGILPGEVSAIVDGRTRNLSRSTVQGLDFDLGYVKPLVDGSINLSLGGTRLFTIDNRITDSAPRNNVAGTLGAPVKLRLRGRAGVVLGAFDGGIAVNHVASYRNLTVTPAERVKSWTTVDLQLGLRIGEAQKANRARSFRLAFSVNNLFDTDPPYAQFRSTGVTIGYDPEQASAIGRSLALQAIIGW